VIRRILKSEVGNSIAEMSLLTALVLVPAIWYQIAFYELSVTRLKLQEGARYGAWEFTIQEVSDWMGGDHAGRFTNLMSGIKGKVRTTYGDDLNSMTPKYAASSQAGLFGFDVSFQDSDFKFESKDPQIFSIASVQAGNNTMDWFLNNMGFNTNGFIYADLGVTLTNRNFPNNSMSSMIGVPLFGQSTFSMMPMRVAVLADTWDIKSGAAVDEDTCDQTGFGKQVGRTAFVGFLGSIQNVMGGSVQKALNYIDIDDPFRFTRVTSHPYNNRSETSGQSSNLEVCPDSPAGHGDYTPNDDSGDASSEKNFHTASLKLENSETGFYIKNLTQQFGNYYLNCPKSQQQEGSCTYQ
jgi:hypothetical protein